MQIGVIKEGIKSKVDLIDADQVFLCDGTNIVPLDTPENIDLLRKWLRDFMEGACT